MPLVVGASRANGRERLSSDSSDSYGPKAVNGGNSMRILVTGGAGYIGSVLVPKLLARGHQVRVLDRMFWGLPHYAAEPGVELVNADVRRMPEGVLDGIEAELARTQPGIAPRNRRKRR